MKKIVLLILSVAAFSMADDVCDSAMSCLKLGNDAVKNGDEAASLALYKKSCELGEMSGCYNVGHIFEMKKDIANAKIYYKKSCDGGLNVGCSTLYSLNEK